MPNASIDGTQMPMKIAAFGSPLKYSISEKISDRNADINKSLSVVVNFLNMILFCFKFCKILTEQRKSNKNVWSLYYFFLNYFTVCLNKFEH